MSEKVARGIEARLELPSGWLDRDERVGAPPMDDALLVQCIQAVTAALEDAGKRPGAERFAELVALAYAQGRREGACDEAFVARLVRLA